MTSSADSGSNTLRDALANADSGDTIVFALAPNSTITLASTLTVTNDVSIDGAGSRGLTISGDHAVAGLRIESAATATILNLTIAAATTGIINQGTLTVSKCTLLENSNIGIANTGTLTVANSTFSGNSALSVGGAIKLAAGSAIILNNTFVNNYAQYGGAVGSTSSSASTVVNNLFLGNFATESGGSIHDSAGMVSADHNLYWNNSDTSGTQGTNCDGCASNTNARTADPSLDGLADNGGPTQSYLPGVGSSAIDIGDDATCAGQPVNNVDQRGSLRPFGAHCDVGSLESNDYVFGDGFEPAIAYSTGFEACQSGWTLTGDWECGVPENVGPPAAFEGMQCLGTQIAGNYHDFQTWPGTTATSPAINLNGRRHPVLTFRMWVDTEGATYDGADLMISIDGGVTYSIVTSVAPAYPLTIAGNPAWGGHLAGLGWQSVQADLSTYSGNIVRLRFAFRSDSSGNYPGFYLDALSVQ